MKNTFSYQLITLFFIIFMVCFTLVFYALGWEEPTEPPPGGNISVPVNIGSTSQVKAGALGIEGLLRAYSSLVVTGNSTNPVAGSCPDGYNWYDDGDAIPESGECKITSLYSDLNGRVGIGTTSPTEKLQINDGDIRILRGDICSDDGLGLAESVVCLRSAGGGGGFSFGNWETRSFDATYQAATDGFAFGWMEANTYPYAVGYTGANQADVDSELDSVKKAVFANYHGYSHPNPNVPVNTIMPVRKGDYWRIKTGSLYSGGITGGRLYWLPVIEGGGGESLPVCADGQILKYNLSLSTWQCADESGGGGSCSLGSWESTNSSQATCGGGACDGLAFANNIAYQAATDGFVIASDTTGNDMIVYVDKGDTATTLPKVGELHTGHAGQATLTIPIEQGKYWRTRYANTIYWVPINCGG